MPGPVFGPILGPAVGPIVGPVTLIASGFAIRQHCGLCLQLRPPRAILSSTAHWSKRCLATDLHLAARPVACKCNDARGVVNRQSCSLDCFHCGILSYRRDAGLDGAETPPRPEKPGGGEATATSCLTADYPRNPLAPSPPSLQSVQSFHRSRLLFQEGASASTSRCFSGSFHTPPSKRAEALRTALQAARPRSQRLLPTLPRTAASNAAAPRELYSGSSLSVSSPSTSSPPVEQRGDHKDMHLRHIIVVQLLHICSSAAVVIAAFIPQLPSAALRDRRCHKGTRSPEEPVNRQQASRPPSLPSLSSMPVAASTASPTAGMS